MARMARAVAPGAPHHITQRGNRRQRVFSARRTVPNLRTPLGLDDARRIVGEYVDHYNQVRLHSAIGYVEPLDKLLGR